MISFTAVNNGTFDQDICNKDVTVVLRS